MLRGLGLGLLASIVAIIVYMAIPAADDRMKTVWEPTCFLWNPRTNTRQDIPAPPGLGEHALATLHDGRVIAIEYGSTAIWDPRTERWTRGAPLPGGIYRPSIGVFPDDRVVVVDEVSARPAQMADRDLRAWTSAGRSVAGRVVVDRAGRAWLHANKTLTPLDGSAPPRPCRVFVVLDDGRPACLSVLSSRALGRSGEWSVLEHAPVASADPSLQIYMSKEFDRAIHLEDSSIAVALSGEKILVTVDGGSELVDVAANAVSPATRGKYTWVEWLVALGDGDVLVNGGYRWRHATNTWTRDLDAPASLRYPPTRLADGRLLYESTRAVDRGPTGGQSALAIARPLASLLAFVAMLYLAFRSRRVIPKPTDAVATATLVSPVPSTRSSPYTPLGFVIGVLVVVGVVVLVILIALSGYHPKG